jgi:hypothetical protein
MLQLHRALDEFLTPPTAQFRRELIDLARHYGGPQGPGCHHATEGDVGAADFRAMSDAPTQSGGRWGLAPAAGWRRSVAMRGCPT